MNIPLSVNQTELLDVLSNVAITRPVFIWGAPGNGKSSIVENFAKSLGLPCVSLFCCRRELIFLLSQKEKYLE